MYQIGVKTNGCTEEGRDGIAPSPNRSPGVLNVMCKMGHFGFKIVLCLESKHSAFTALLGMQTRSSDQKAVRPSVKRVHCDKTHERSVKISIPYERSFCLVF